MGLLQLILRGMVSAYFRLVGVVLFWVGACDLFGLIACSQLISSGLMSAIAAARFVSLLQPFNGRRLSMLSAV